MSRAELSPASVVAVVVVVVVGNKHSASVARRAVCIPSVNTTTSSSCLPVALVFVRYDDPCLSVLVVFYLYTLVVTGGANDTLVE